MNKLFVAFCILLVGTSPCFGAATGQPIFGPRTHDVRERYGAENRYTDEFAAAAGPALIKLQNGETMAERADVIALSLNKHVLLNERPYEYRFLACFVRLNAENSLELLLKDARPSGFRRPAPTRKNVTLTVLGSKAQLPPLTVLGLGSWEELPDYLDTLNAIHAPASFSLAIKAASLESDVSERGDAVRQLADRRDPQALRFFLRLLEDRDDNADVRAEAALAIGYLRDKSAIPALIQGLMDPNDEVRIGAARALSLYPEEETRVPLSDMFEHLDSMMSGAIARTIVDTGWRPVNTLLGLADSPDPVVANLGVELLTGVRDPRVLDKLLAYLEKPGQHDVRFVILALGETKSEKAADALLRFGGEPSRRKGAEGELGVALAELGDRRAEGVIVEMINQAGDAQLRILLERVYKKLIGKEFAPQAEHKQ